MPGKTTIAWSQASWNPTSGCIQVTAGCQRCYALTMHRRFHAAYLQNNGWRPDGKPMPRQYAVPFSEVQLLPERLEWPLEQKKPLLIFVNSASDLFHSAVPDDYIRQVFDVMRRAHWHTFQVLTKRAGRLRTLGPMLDWPANVWMGVSIESDLLVKRADALRTGAARAAVRFLSCEPLLGPLSSLNLESIDWLIAGAESGAGARPMQDEWVRDLRDRCVQQGIPLFFKQRALNGKKQEHPLLDGVLWEQFPEVGALQAVMAATRAGLWEGEG